MKVVIAPQAFKGSLSAMQASRAIALGVRRVFPRAEITLVPVADGGDGTLQALVHSSSGTLCNATVTGPLGTPVDACWGVMGDGVTAVIEMAQASGLALVPEARRDPRFTTTYGTGELIQRGLDAGYRNFIVGVGGSATNDGGAGMAAALGVRFLNKFGQGLPCGGAALSCLARIDMAGLDARVHQCEMFVATDVSNPLCGAESGASAVYGPQKGATPQTVMELEAALSRYADILERDVGADVRYVPGAGAAGGLAAGLIAFLNARLRSGVDVVCDAVGLDEYLEGAHLVITGEGCVDAQTVLNKAPIGVAWRAKRKGLPVIAIAGSLGHGYQAVFANGIDDVEAAVGTPVSMAPFALVADAAERAMCRAMMWRNFASN